MNNICHQAGDHSCNEEYGKPVFAHGAAGMERIASHLDDLSSRANGKASLSFAAALPRHAFVALCGDFLGMERELETFARHSTEMPDNFINAEGNNVTDAFKFYCRPLLGSGFPTAHRLRTNMAPKILRPND